MKVGIIFEGGAFRTIFSCGVMDALLEHDIVPNYMIGVSAGGAYGVSYAARQAKRNLNILLKYRNDKRYMGVGNLLDKNNKSIYGLEFSYATIPNELVPFDYDAFKAYPGVFKCVVTNVETGEAEYLDYTGDDPKNKLLQATCALPLAFPIIEIDGKSYLDGGLADSIPFEKAFADGCDKLIVVLTREAGYQKSTSGSTKAIAKAYKDYPKIQELLLTRADRYNESLKRLEEYEKEGRCYIMRPKKSKGFGRMEKDLSKILSMYNDGYNQCYHNIDEIKDFIS